MYSKQRSEIKKHLELEENMKRLESVMNAFDRVKSGKSFNLTDLKIVQEEFKKLYGENNSNNLNFEHAIYRVTREINDVNEVVQVSKKRLRRKGVNLERLRRQQRDLRLNKLKEEKVVELER